jgi:hypothetical protein
MSRKISLVEKRIWLLEFESGLSEYSLHKKHKKDIRTIKSGLDTARLDRNYNDAKVGMMKGVLLKHQGRLLERLHEYQLSVKVTKEDAEVLSWYPGDKSVFSKKSVIKTSEEPSDPVTTMLQQHLTNDKLWKLIDEWAQAQNANMIAREVLQRRIFSVLKGTGYPVVDQGSIIKPCLYADTVGPLFYRWALIAVFSPRKSAGPEQEIVARTEQCAVMFRGTVLVEASNNPEEDRTTLIKAYQRVRRLAEVQQVLDTQDTLKQVVEKLHRVIDEILLIDYVPGDCRVCRRMSQL